MVEVNIFVEINMGKTSSHKTSLQFNFFSSEKRALSQVVEVLLLISFSILAFILVSNISLNLVHTQIDKSKICSGLRNNILIDQANTCYNTSSKEIQFGIVRKDINLDSLLVTISGAENSHSFTINETPSTSEELKPYNSTGSSYGTSPFSLPSKNSEKTYIGNVTNVNDPYEIDINPSSEKESCGTMDSFLEINTC